MSVAYKYTLAAIGGLVGYFASTGWLILICFLIVLYDSYTAYQLATRVKAKYPHAADGKFKSHAAQKVIKKLIEVSSLIILAYLIDDKVVIMFNFYLPYIVAGVFIFIQAWSILENMSSCNGGKWAKILQTIMVDKTARHFDIDPERFKSILNETDSDDNDTGNAGIMSDTAKD